MCEELDQRSVRKMRQAWEEGRVLERWAEAMQRTGQVSKEFRFNGQ